MITTGITIGLIALAVLAFIILMFASYVKAPPDHAFIITGLSKQPRILIGRAGFKLPFFERLDCLSLGAFQIDVKTSDPVPTKEFINVNIDSTVSVRIGQTPELLQIAAKNFLNAKKDDIAERINDLLQGNLREITGTMALTEMVSNRKAFSEKVQENAVPDLQRLGLELVSFNVQNFSDKNGVINDLGIDNVQQIKKQAAIAKSDAERDIAVRQAENQKAANDAQVEAAKQIAEQNTALDIRTAELKASSEVKRAAADMSYDIQKADRQKELDVTRTNAQIAQTEREVELKKQQIELKEKELDAVVRKEADAKLYAAQKQAEADLVKRQKEAEAKAYEEVQRAKAEQESAVARAEAIKAEADAKMYAAQKDAEAIRARLTAEADGIRAKGVAEAEGIEKKAEAQKKMGEASVLEMYFRAMPEVAKAVAEPLTAVDKITLYGEGATPKLVGDLTQSVDRIMAGLTDGLGFDAKAALAGFLGAKVATSGETSEG